MGYINCANGSSAKISKISMLSFSNLILTFLMNGNKHFEHINQQHEKKGFE